jgi:RNA polymerase sigma-70 factor (ECF subfamily)
MRHSSVSKSWTTFLARAEAIPRFSGLIQSLKPLDRQVIISWLEGMDAVTIGEITGLSPPNVAMKVHRIKAVLTRRFHSGVRHAE